MRTGGEVNMLEVAKTALVSEATAYRYFPDLATLLQSAMAEAEQRTGPAEALAAVGDSPDPVERVAAATEYLLRRVLTYQGAVRATIAATITRPDTVAATRPGLRFGLIEHALAPLAERPEGVDQAVLAQLKNDLAVVVSAEALFCLTDLCGLDPEAAVTSAVHTATTLTRAALSS
jgi:AcrR family transcriptional regulator